MEKYKCPTCSQNRQTSSASQMVVNCYLMDSQVRCLRWELPNVSYFSLDLKRNYFGYELSALFLSETHSKIVSTFFQLRRTQFSIRSSV